jgi:hypothetical protein
VGAAIAALEATNQLENTYVIFTSDNGYHLGQFRMSGGKTSPFEEDIHLPLYIRGPGVTAGSSIPHLVANIDLAVTFADLAGINVQNTSAIPTAVDGRSFKSVLLSGGSSISTDSFRQGFLVEKLVTSTDTGHIPTPFVRYTEGNASADLWSRFRSYPTGGSPWVLNALGRGAGAPVNDASGVTVYPGLQSYNTPQWNKSSTYSSFPATAATNHFGWAVNTFTGLSNNQTYGGSFYVNPFINGSFASEAPYHSLAVALSGYANNKGATFEDLHANWLSAQTGGPTDALGNGILGALNVVNIVEGAPWWGGFYAVNQGVFPNGTKLASSTPFSSYSLLNTTYAAWARKVSSTFPKADPLVSGALPTDPYGVNAWGFGNANLKVDYQLITGFNWPGTYYALRLISSKYNLIYIGAGHGAAHARLTAGCRPCMRCRLRVHPLTRRHTQSTRRASSCTTSAAPCPARPTRGS